MIDNKKAKKVFENYVEKYDRTNPRIDLKVEHTYRVAKVARKIATELNLSEEQIELAELIGLLHDIGRFEQLKRFDTFSDSKSINHAEFGVKILIENDFISEFCEDKKYHETIILAIRNHNKYKIDENLTGENLIQSKIIRDADKLDILNLVRFEPFETLYKKNKISNEPFTKEVLESFLKEKQVERSMQKTYMDDWLSMVGLIFDINFKPSFKIIKEEDYINQIIDRTKTEDMEKARKVANKYIAERA